MNDFIESIEYGQRLQLFRRYLDTDMQILEVGPSHSPVAPRRAGFMTDIIDAADQPTLVAKYAALGVDTTNIEPVDYLWTGRSIAALVGKQYDHIIASHVIEHVPDPVGFLRDCEQILGPRGRLHLAVPDATRCFDFLRPFSTAGQMLQAFHQQSSRHPPMAIYDFHAMYAHLNGHASWFGDADRPGDITLGNPVVLAYEQFRKALETADYQDVHGWVFTPYSFLLVLHDLYTLGLLGSLKVERVCLTSAHEFHVIFSKQSAFDLHLQVDKAELWQRQLEYAGYWRAAARPDPVIEPQQLPLSLGLC